MEYILQEINSHKTKLMSLINGLINTQLINEEIFINNEIKKESYCLISLLNVKQNILMKQNNINNKCNINPFMFQPNEININPLQPGIIPNNLNNFGNHIDNNSEVVNVTFEDGITKKITLICRPDDLFSDLIKKYKEKSMDHRDNWYLFNNERLNDRMNSSLKEIGIVNFSRILIYTPQIALK